MREGIDCKGKKWKERSLNKRMNNLTGQTFYDLTALFPITREGQSRTEWLCKCCCGNEVIVEGQKLLNGNTKSCGCRNLRLLSNRHEDARQALIGQKFGFLKVVEYLGMRLMPDGKTRRPMYKCLCDCGNYTEVMGSQLKNGRTKSCGCLHKQKVHELLFKDLTGQKFGNLYVKSLVGYNNHQNAMWLCLCDCGNEKVVCSHDLIRLHTTSCGCYKKSRGEENIEKILKENNFLYKKEVVFQDLYFLNSNNKLRYDFAIYNENGNLIRLIEFDGEQHFKPVSFYGGEKHFQETKARDSLKNQYAKSHNIPLVRIPYTERNNISLEILFNNKYLI